MMIERTLTDCLQSEQTALERVKYFQRQLLTAADMDADQDYFRQKLRRHNRFLHGWGVVCGLEVKAAPTEASPRQVCIGPGYALGPWGNEIYLGEPVCLDLDQCGPGAVTDPCEPSLIHPGQSAGGQTLYIAIKYAECVARPVRAMPAGCGCEEDACEYSRIRDSFQLECLADPPLDPDPPSLCDFLEGVLPPCLPCPTDPWVVLAQVTLPPREEIADSNINNFVRRQLYSTAVLQEQLIACCCEGEPEPSLLQIEKVEFLAGSLVKDELVQPQSIHELGDREDINAIRVHFNKNLDASSITTGNFDPDTGQFSFLVVPASNISDSYGNLGYVPGPLVVEDNRVTFTVHEEFGDFVNGTYTVVLFGDKDPQDLRRFIRADDDSQLDGEASQLPSGDGNPGGNFEFVFRISPSID